MVDHCKLEKYKFYIIIRLNQSISYPENKKSDFDVKTKSPNRNNLVWKSKNDERKHKCNFSESVRGKGGDTSLKHRTVHSASRRGAAKREVNARWVVDGRRENRRVQEGETSLTCAHFVGLLSPRRPDATRRSSGDRVAHSCSSVVS